MASYAPTYPLTYAFLGSVRGGNSLSRDAQTSLNPTTWAYSRAVPGLPRNIVPKASFGFSPGDDEIPEPPKLTLLKGRAAAALV